MLFDYNDKDVNSIMTYAKKLENQTYNDILNACDDYLDAYDKGLVNNRPAEFIESLKNDTYKTNTKAKGQLGNFIEKFYFGYEPNSYQEADLHNVGIEIKQTPINIKKNGKMSAGERLSITMIPFNKEVTEDFYDSDLWHKIKNILLIQYVRDKSIPRLDNVIKFVNLFTPSKEDLKIIIDDYNKINQKIKEGKAHELSESDTLYLGAAPKGASAKKSLRPQFYNDKVLAKRRTYSFKRQYMDYILNNYVIPGKLNYESFITDEDLSSTDSFEDIILKRINKYYGISDYELCKQFDLKYTSNQAQWVKLAYKMLGISSNKAKEFQLANVVVKTIRIEENNNIKEDMSLPPFQFMDIVNEEWESSNIYKYFEEKRFFFVTFKKDGDYYKFYKAMFWNMPYNDLNVTVKNEWLKAKEVITTGVEFTKNNDGTISNNLPKKSETEITHIRPHTKKSAYKLNDGTKIGDITKYANILPSGEYMTTQSFWLNNTYIKKQLNIK